MLGKALLTAATGMMAGGEALGVEDVFSTFLYTGNGSTQTITNGIALADGVAIAPGTALGGGYFAGFISSTANGVATHALIVAPRATGATGDGYTLTTNLQWKTSNTTTANTTSPFDGAANTAAMIAAGASAHPAAQFCNNLTIGGYSDWYLPARYELDIAYFNLKPTTQGNSTSWGINDYSVPKRTSNYTSGTPAQTSIAAFQSGGGEDFVANYHWSSTEDSASTAWLLTFNDGAQSSGFNNKNLTSRVRAFRKIPINDPALDPYRVTGEGGMVWRKARTQPSNSGYFHQLIDTERGSSQILFSNTADAQTSAYPALVGFNSDGFTMAGGSASANQTGDTYASWTFRKAPKFFDVVTYTGNGTLLTVNHNLGSVPGCIIVKRTDSAGNWPVYHRSLSADATVYLNTTSSAATRIEEFGSVTSTTFQVGDAGGASSQTNANGGTYVAYVFAHDAGGFGDDGNQNVISCGSYTGTSTDQSINLGWEPQWILIKNATSSSGPANWLVFDNMRKWGVRDTGDSISIKPNLGDAEGASHRIHVNSTGFEFQSEGASAINASGQTYIYIAIRRGPMKTPTSATEVFEPDHSREDYTTSGFGKSFYAGFPVDFAFNPRGLDGTSPTRLAYTRLTGDSYLRTNNIDAESTSSNNLYWDSNVGWYQSGAASLNDIAYMFRRAPGFFDVVAYTGTGASPQTVSHNLGVAPELMIVKYRSTTSNWLVYNKTLGASQFIILSSAGSKETSTTLWGNTDPTATQFTTGINLSGATVIAYLFATLPGVSKVGSYTGTGATLDIDCGFTNGARFVLIKRTDSAGDWYVWDTARGIIAANDPYLLLNSTAAENTATDYIDPLSSGFQISSTAPAAINANGGSFIFLAIA